MGATIRSAKVGDLARLQYLFRRMLELYSFEQDVNYPYSDHGVRYLTERIASSMCAVAEVDGAVVGFVAGSMGDALPFKTYRRHGFVENLFVEEGQRNMGVGQLLVRHFIGICVSAGVHRINTDSEDRPELREFYRRLGFVETGIQYEFRG